MDAQLQQVVELLKEQNQLLKKHLWRIKFSLLTLLLLTTGICICLGVMIYSKPIASLPPVIGPSGSSGIRFRPTNNGQLQLVVPSQNAVPTSDAEPTK